MGQIQVTIQTEERLQVIKSLANSLSGLVAALGAQPQVNVTGCTFTGGPGVVIDAAEEVHKTKIVEIGDDKQKS